MGVTFQNAGRQNCDQKNKIILIPITLAVFILVLAMGAGSAWSFDQIQADDAHENIKSTKNFSNSSSPGIVDGCLPLLKSIRQPHTSTAMNPNQRSAGQAAALGLVFGFRFALEPTSRKSKSPKPRLDVWEHHGEIAGNAHALAVADYRRCQKEKALKSSIQALQDFRWAR